MWVSPLSTLDEIWNCSTWLICAGSRVRISPTPAQPALSSPPACAAARRAPIARHQMPCRERAGGGEQAQRGAPVEARAAQRRTAQAEQRVARVEVVGLPQLLADPLVVLTHQALVPRPHSHGPPLIGAAAASTGCRTPPSRPAQWPPQTPGQGFAHLATTGHATQWSGRSSSKLRHALAAGGLGEAAAGMEDAAGRRVERARHLARQDLVLARLLGRRIGQRHRRQQRPGVGVAADGRTARRSPRSRRACRDTSRRRGRTDAGPR